MKRPIFKIGAILLAVVLLPILFFSAYEVGSFRQTERMIDSVYNNQLSAILYSVNQYSEDVVDSWANKMEQFYAIPDSGRRNERIKKFMLENPSIWTVFCTNYDVAPANFNFFMHRQEPTPELSQEVAQVIQQNQQNFSRLQNYLKAGNYRKITPFALKSVSSGTLLLFFVQQYDGTTMLCGIVVNTEEFIPDQLPQKIQLVATDRFYIWVSNRQTGTRSYFNIYNQGEWIPQDKEPFRLFPAYELNIQSAKETISDLVEARSETNLLLILAVDLLLLLGAWVVFSYVRKEVRLAQIKSEFVSNVSHEIRTPLALINMFIETLEMGRVRNEEKKQEYYSIISQETKRLSSIVNKILNFSKIESGKRTFKLAPACINSIAEDVLRTYKYHLQSKGFKYDLIITPELPQLQLDAEAVTDAVINLLDNAMKYSDQQKYIKVSTGQEGREAYIEIKDSGIGISANDQKLIYDKFYRVTSGNLAHRARGSGLGLSIVKHIMDAHQGRISLVSIEGRGSAFRLNFPAPKTDSETKQVIKDVQDPNS